MKAGRVALLAVLVGCLPASVFAVVVNFDDLPNGPVPVGYQGLTWGTSSDHAVPGQTGSFTVSNSLSYATPHSAPNYVYNSYGPDNLWFSFAGPVSFSGAWFANAGATPGHKAEEVRFRDDLGNLSAWLNLSDAPQFLDASFSGSTTVYVERRGGVGGSETLGDGRWYTMDDVTYDAVPEPSTILLVGGGLLALFAQRRKSY